MLELTPHTAADYLRERGTVGSDEAIDVRELAGGVSNTVLLVVRPDGESFILKQSLPRLKVQQEWLCSIERIWREVEVLEICGQLLASGGRLTSETQPPDTSPSSFWTARVPQILFSDRANYCFAMTAALPVHKTWKELLLAGDADPSIAVACGRLLGTLHAESWRDAKLANQLEDRSFFDALRLDPYYRRLAEVHPDLAPVLANLIDECHATRLSLVHGDFSPKNLLIAGSEIWLIDFEVGHFGDPAFDLGFFLTHLALKAIHAGPRREDFRQLIATFWTAYHVRLAVVASAAEISELSRRAALHWAACLLARIDGKSPVDYLSPEQQERVRKDARQNLLHPQAGIEQLLSSVSHRLGS